MAQSGLSFVANSQPDIPDMRQETYRNANHHFLIEPYIGCPCPWVLGGHGCDITVHGRAWVGMSWHRSLLMVMVWVWVQIRRKCWALLPKPFALQPWMHTPLSSSMQAFIL